LDRTTDAVMRVRPVRRQRHGDHDLVGDRARATPPSSFDAAWRAQLRLHRRWAHLDAARAKKRTSASESRAPTDTTFMLDKESLCQR